MRIVIIILCLTLALPTLALYQVSVPKEDIGREIVLETRLKENGQWIGTTRSRLKKQRYKNEEFLVAISSVDGKDKKGRPALSNGIAYFKLDGDKINLYSLSGQTSIEGKPAFDFKATFNWETMTARLNYNNYLDNKAADKSVELTENSIMVQNLTGYARNMIAEKKKETTVKTIVPSGDTFGMKIKVVYEPEEILIKKKRYNTYRVEMKPDLGLLSLVIPNVNYWFRADPPYDFLRYEGLQSGPGSPDIIQERVYKEE
jgi:hypothetical protein